MKVEKVKYAIRGLYAIFTIILINSFCDKVGINMEEYTFECTTLGITFWYLGQKVLCRGAELFNKRTNKL